jgi:transaldolase
MKLFLDSADPTEIKTAWDTGMIDGVTTNPTLATKAGVSFKEAIESILETVKGPINLEVLSTDYEAMVSEGEKLAKLDDRVHVKLPTIPDGIKACKTLSDKGIKINMTLVFSAAQALLCAKAGATFVSPFVGRLDDIDSIGTDVVAEIRKLYDNYGFETEILAASVRSVRQVVDAALIGADITTVPFKIFMGLFNHPLTDAGLDRFLSDWEESGQESIIHQN